MAFPPPEIAEVDLQHRLVRMSGEQLIRWLYPMTALGCACPLRGVVEIYEDGRVWSSEIGVLVFGASPLQQALELFVLEEIMAMERKIEALGC